MERKHMALLVMNWKSLVQHRPSADFLRWMGRYQFPIHMTLLIHMMVENYQYHFSISVVLSSVAEYKWKQIIPNLPNQIMNLYLIKFVYNQLGSP